MEHLAAFRAHQLERLHGLAAEVGNLSTGVLFCQVWTTYRGERDRHDPNPVVLCVEAQSAVSTDVIDTYARLSAVCGVRKDSMELLGECSFSGATRLIEDLEQADTSQHPRDKLPGTELPACSAIMLPVFDPADPFSRRGGRVNLVPSAVLEVLVCKSVRLVYNHSDLINSVCQVMDKFKFGISADACAFREWRKQLAASASRTPSPHTPPLKQSPRTSMSRTSSMRLLTSDDSDEKLPARGSRRQTQPFQNIWLPDVRPVALAQLSS